MLELNITQQKDFIFPFWIQPLQNGRNHTRFQIDDICVLPNTDESSMIANVCSIFHGNWKDY